MLALLGLAHSPAPARGDRQPQDEPARGARRDPDRGVTRRRASASRPGKFVTAGIQAIAPVVAMFVFAILFFGILTDAGLFDPVLDRVLRAVGTQPSRIVPGHGAPRGARAPRRLGRRDVPRRGARHACHSTSGWE